MQEQANVYTAYLWKQHVHLPIASSILSEKYIVVECNHLPPVSMHSSIQIFLRVTEYHPEKEKKKKISSI